MYFEKINLYMRVPEEGSCYPTFSTQNDKKYDGALNWVKNRKHIIEEDVDNYFKKSRVVGISYRETSGAVFKVELFHEDKTLLVDIRPEELLDILKNFGVNEGGFINSPVGFVKEGSQTKLTAVTESMIEHEKKLRHKIEFQKEKSEKYSLKDLKIGNLYQKKISTLKDASTYFLYLGNTMYKGKEKPLYCRIILGSSEKPSLIFENPNKYIQENKNTFFMKISNVFYNEIPNPYDFKNILTKNYITFLKTITDHVEGKIYCYSEGEPFKKYVNKITNKPMRNFDLYDVNLIPSNNIYLKQIHYDEVLNKAKSKGFGEEGNFDYNQLYETYYSHVNLETAFRNNEVLIDKSFLPEIKSELNNLESNFIEFINLSNTFYREREYIYDLEFALSILVQLNVAFKELF